MPFKTDNGGLALRANIKVSAAASSWSTRLSQIMSRDGEIIICTYSLPNMDYIDKIFDKRSKEITILANSTFYSRALELKQKYPALNIILAANTHAKMVLISPGTVWLSSANLGKSGWFENTVGIKSKEVYEFYHSEIMSFIEKHKIIELNGGRK